MITIKHITLGLAALSTALLLSAGARAQELDGTWFKLKVNAKGHVVDAESGTLVNKKVKTVAYANLLWSEDNQAYLIDIWTERADDVWRVTHSTGAASVSPSGELWVDTWMRVDVMDGSWVAGYHTFRVDVDVDAAGQVTSAVLKQLGGEGVDGHFEGATTFAGTMKVKGFSLAPEDLPFDPVPQA